LIWYVETHGAASAERWASWLFGEPRMGIFAILLWVVCAIPVLLCLEDRPLKVSFKTMMIIVSLLSVGAAIIGMLIRAFDVEW
jgi:hypothetical protein